MLNQFILVGRLANTKTESNKSIITLAVPRSYKNENGEYDTDFIDIVLYSTIAENTKNYCNKGDLIGITGRVQTTQTEKNKITEIIGNKVTFLSSHTTTNTTNDISKGEI